MSVIRKNATRAKKQKLAARLEEIKQRQCQQREQLLKTQAAGQAAETRERQKRFSQNFFRGLWDRITGKHAKIN